MEAVPAPSPPVLLTTTNTTSPASSTATALSVKAMNGIEDDFELRCRRPGRGAPVDGRGGEFVIARKHSQGPEITTRKDPGARDGPGPPALREWARAPENQERPR
ncbi:hypothetical protein GCM10017788_63360 [Amycolatopsis acidiphila]|nr:hypothetical protein GCM10017788_63360 [Amycolatopsis acidiphila]